MAAALFVLTLTTTYSQTATGSITGIVRDPDGVVPTAVIHAISSSDGARSSATSDRDGRYTLSGLPPGSYVVSVEPMGLRTMAFTERDVQVASGQPTPLDITLTRGNLGVVGDDNAFLGIRTKYAGLTGALPRTADGKPDLSGVWQANLDPSPAAAALLPWAADVMKERRANAFRDLPGAHCLPGDPGLTIPLLYKVIQTPTLLVFLFESDPHYRQVYLDGRAHPPDLDPTWMGHSIGRWEGDTLVVETVGFNDKSWIDFPGGFPHKEGLRIVERFTRHDLARMTHAVRYEDAESFSQPLVRNAAWSLAPGEDIMEAICTENNRYDEFIGATR
jgi:hypothetical protein